MRIIPAIDIINGKCVRLTKGNYNTKKIYNENPLEVAKHFESVGVKHIHLVDLDGAKSNRIINYNILEQIATETNLSIDFGGGLKSDEDLYIAFSSGAKQVTGGSIAVKSPNVFDNWIRKYGQNKIILGADCKDEKIATNGWQEQSNLALIPFIKNYQKKGIQYVICTDISKDGMLEGPSLDLYRNIISKCNDNPIKLIASGGVSNINELHILKNIGCEGVIIGKALYENKITLKELEKFI
ncbi:1-(5-phosphoribosyl)-5-[(5-phosphoribosylamino)methylideneamino]imidazole-4-carboxamide isomerase [Mangrovimonas spongiae]|uniref:1-(5-phosphoribosyl)-5-[(5-phosphoribosylamino)methylideneamino] imidazole-4-carboxamide isomerase n=1 Tax=Mangrovimonas spongiae TaxID=2494697 RepID=A0A3R9NLH1_9FLAO|nr:1-(5-phosphoribosyl)-5-[(5-phosphoribosylamino)methylideneamino]imidazole-4-carboxamide isomerase [Mangrovimonas spongiae]RSK38685.1 1-(5-phosphoribosyl)-5-[(5-phosphoribosylamino)methylideneamino]imidazole-4-carboxamide isomerase [Mangrovimonas spongiae]